MSKNVTSEGWYFVQENANKSDYPAIFSRVVIWHENSKGDVVGLISANGTGFSDGETKNSLVSPPPVVGTYIHWEDMTEADREAAFNQRRPSYLK